MSEEATPEELDLARAIRLSRDSASVMKCGEPTRDGKPCRHKAGEGTTHAGYGPCELHDGNLPAIVDEQHEIMRQHVCLAIGAKVEVTPVDTIMDALYESTGNVAFYRGLVTKLGENVTEEEQGPGGATRRMPNVLIQMYDRERDRQVAIAAMAIKSGIQIKKLQLAQADAASMFESFSMALDVLDLAPSQIEKVRRAFATALRNRSSVPAASVGGD